MELKGISSINYQLTQQILLRYEVSDISFYGFTIKRIYTIFTYLITIHRNTRTKRQSPALFAVLQPVSTSFVPIYSAPFRNDSMCGYMDNFPKQKVETILDIKRASLPIQFATILLAENWVCLEMPVSHYLQDKYTGLSLDRIQVRTNLS